MIWRVVGWGKQGVMTLMTLRKAMSDIWAFIGVRRRFSLSYKRMGEKDVIPDRTLSAVHLIPFPTRRMEAKDVILDRTLFVM